MHRYTFIDSLRGLAAMAVVIFHLNEAGAFSDSFYQRLVKYGHLGVPVFFVISGFVVYLSLERAANIKDFLTKRLFRIYPPYLASLVVVMFVISVRKFLTSYNDFVVIPHSFSGWLATLTLMIEPISSVKGINWVYWTLVYEIAFYLMAGFALLNRKVWWPVFFAPFIGSVFLPDHSIFFVKLWCYFALGAGLAAYRSQGGWISKLLIAVSIVDMTLHKNAPYMIASLSAFICIFACTSRWGAWLNKENIFRKVGVYSYSLYLTHVPMGCWFALRIDPYPRQISQSHLAFHILIDFGILAFCCAFAFVFWNVIEKPFASKKTISLLSFKPFLKLSTR